MKSGKVDCYGTTYREFAARIYAEVRAKAFGTDIGQTGWLSVEEQDMFLSWLRLERDHRVLDVACGSGGPTLRIARLSHCYVQGIDVHEKAILTARNQAREAGLEDRATFERVDAGKPLPLANGSFDAVVCVDAINHLPDRAFVFREWVRILKPGGHVVFSDPIIVSGPLTNEEIAIRSSIGFFLFVPPGLNEDLLAEAGFSLIERENRTENVARMAGGWREAREAHSDDLRRIEGDETFEGQQAFLETAASLAATRRLSRFAYCARSGGLRGESSIHTGSDR